MAELLAVDERVVFSVPANVNGAQAAWVEPLATAVRAVQWATVSSSGSAAVIGAGPIGLLVTQLLVAAGLNVGVFEPSAYRRDSARRLGAKHAWLPDEATLMYSCSTWSSNVPVLCPGSRPRTRIARPAGTVVLVGLATGKPSPSNRLS